MSTRKWLFICLAPILAARVLGPAAGVRITLGSKACPEAKHAAVMGADVRPCPEREILVDQKNRVVSTPAYMYDDARLADVKVQLDRAWDLLRQRRAHEEFGLDPDNTSERPADVVEGYEQ